MTAPPFAFGSRIYPGLAKLVEEGGEMQQIAGKIMMTGGEVKNHWDGTDMPVAIAMEVADVSAACRAFFQLNGYDGARWVLEREIQKYHQFLEWHGEQVEDKPDSTVPYTGYSRLQRFFGAGSDLHHQIYWAWRVYPQAMLMTIYVGTLLAFIPGFLLWVLT